MLQCFSQIPKRFPMILRMCPAIHHIRALAHSPTSGGTFTICYLRRKCRSKMIQLANVIISRRSWRCIATPPPCSSTIMCGARASVRVIYVSHSPDSSARGFFANFTASGTAAGCSDTTTVGLQCCTPLYEVPWIAVYEACSGPCSTGKPGRHRRSINHDPRAQLG